MYTPDPELALSLQKEAQKWRDSASRQQTVAGQLQTAADWQHDLAKMWEEAGDSSLAAQALQFEVLLRQMTQTALHLEERVLEQMKSTLEEAEAALRPRSQTS